MSALDPRLPGTGITIRIARDDGMTFAGITVPNEGFAITPTRAKLAAAPGLSAGEINRANGVTFGGTTSPRDPVRAGPGWGQYVFPASVQLYVVRDDGTHLSYGAPHNLYTVAAAQAALNATAGLSATEQARIASASL